jgi:hypothetical protein
MSRVLPFVCTPADALATVTEASFQRQVLELAAALGWRAFSIRDSRTVTSCGWPDLFLVRDGRALAVELKSERGRLRREQRAWLADLAACPGIETAVWRPADFDTVIVPALTRR